VLLTPFSYLNGAFSEYNTFSFSWADLLMLSVIIIYAIKFFLCQYDFGNIKGKKTSCYNNLKEHIKNLLSIFFRPWKISHETLFILLFLLWCVVSIAWSIYKPFAIYRSLTLLEILTFFYIVYLVIKADSSFLRYYLYFILFSGTLQSLLCIAQFILGHSLGLSIIGESFVSHGTPGVAKIIIDGVKHIRAYGTFPHPNILAGFLVIPIFIIVGKLFDNFRTKVIHENNIGSHSSKSKAEGSISFPRETRLLSKFNILFFILLLINAIGLLLTFSRSAILGLSLGLVIFIFHVNHKNNIKKIVLTLLLLLIMGSFPAINFIHKHSSLLSIQSLAERDLYNNVSHETINKNLVHGVGIGQFVINEYMFYPNMDGWQYQPEHNSYLLIFSELGAIGFVLFSLMLISLTSSIKKGSLLTLLSFYCIIISFCFILFFDHYFWDIKIGTMIFAMGITLIKIESVPSAIKYISL